MTPPTLPAKSYLGDGVYVEFGGYTLTLTTENGISVTNRIVLEPEVYRALLLFVDHLKLRQQDEDADG